VRHARILHKLLLTDSEQIAQLPASAHPHFMTYNLPRFHLSDYDLNRFPGPEAGLMYHRRYMRITIGRLTC